MFGKQQPDVVTAEEVGDYVKSLQGNNALQEVTDEVDNGAGLDFGSKESTSRKKDTK